MLFFHSSIRLREHVYIQIFSFYLHFTATVSLSVVVCQCMCYCISIGETKWQKGLKTQNVDKSTEKYISRWEKENWAQKKDKCVVGLSTTTHTHSSFAIIATHRLMVQKGKTFIERKNVGRKCEVSEKKVCVLVAKMENKYKNDIPNVILDNAHLNCASISFRLTKLFGKAIFIEIKPKRNAPAMAKRFNGKWMKIKSLPFHRVYNLYQKKKIFRKNYLS